MAFPTHETPTGTPEQIHAITNQEGAEPHSSRSSDAALLAISHHVSPDHGSAGVNPNGNGVELHHNGYAVLNAHPHQQHTDGYDTESAPHKTSYESHGFAAFHVAHHNRDKAAEHHPPTHKERY